MGFYEDEYNCGCIAGTSTIDTVPQEYVRKRCGKPDSDCEYAKWLVKAIENARKRGTAISPKPAKEAL